LFVCENNYYAMGTALARSEAETDLLAKVAGYHMRAQRVDGMDVFAVEAAAADIVDYVRREKAPAFLEARTYRLRAHSMYDSQLYRSKTEVKEWEERGPLITLTRRLKSAGLMTEEDFQRLQAEANAEVDDAVQFARAGTLDPVEELQRFIYAESAA
jgi:TPP-dependent pyruvate/acetoin dehydrogenase alpha subunit